MRLFKLDKVAYIISEVGACKPSSCTWGNIRLPDVADVVSDGVNRVTEINSQKVLLGGLHSLW